MKLPAKELRENYPLLSSDESSALEIASEHDEVITELRRFQNEDYLIIINPAEKYLSHRILIGKKPLVVQIEPFGVKIMRLESRD